LIVENAAIPQLEVEANRILGELGGATADCRVELRTQRALKTADALRETLDIVIVTPAGERPYESFSGGERTRLNLALRIALARLLAHRRGAESRLLAIDEPEFLDEAGVARLADVLRGLSGDFDRVLLVSHHPTLAAAFDQAIVVVKDGDRSRVDAEALAAVA
jgi:exonuclease SbcC